jgi:hypothetical protein
MSKHDWLWVLLSLLIFSLVNYPFLEIFNSDRLVAGIPPLAFYLFDIWIGAIALLFIFAQQQSSGSLSRKHK